MENNNSVKKLIDNITFRNWAEGRATRGEAEFWDHWIKLHPDNRKMALEAQQRILGFARKKESNSRAAESWQRFEMEISKTPAEINAKSPSDPHNTTVLLKKKSDFGWLVRVAAIVIVVLSGSFLWSSINDGTNIESDSLVHEEMVYQTIETNYGEQKELQLIDGTQIILNANSMIRYGRSLNRQNRIDIELEGEAFFSVSSRGHENFNAEEDLFQVFTKDGVVRVLGTRFSVSSYNDRTTVVLEEGRVAVAAGESADEEIETETRQWILQPNELAEFSRESEELIKKEIVDTRVYTSWKDSRLFFENIPVRDVILRLEQTFGIPFKVNDPSLLERTVSGSVENSELEVMARIFAEMLNVSVEVSDEQVLITTN